jgi:tape measure domain-containing protein
MAEERIGITIATRGARRSRRDIEGIGEAARGSSTAADLLRASLLGIGGTALIRQLVETADTFTLLQNRIALVTDTTEQYRAVQERLVTASQATFSALGNTVNSYSRIARSTRELGLSQEQLIRITEALNQSFRISGATQQEALSTSIQFTQGLASNRLQGDELRSVLENNARLAQVFTDALDINIGTLRTLGSEGGLTADVLANALLSSYEQLNAEADSLAPTIAQVTTILQDQATVLFGEFAQSFGLIELVTSGITLLGNSLENLAAIAGVVATLFGARLVASLAAYVVSQTAAGVATLTTARFVTGSVVAHGFHTQAVTLGTVALNAFSVASGLAARALALIGGPVGAAVLAVAALTSFRGTQQQASATTLELIDNIDDLRLALGSLTDAQLSAEFDTYSTQLESIQSQIFQVEQRTIDLSDTNRTLNESIGAGNGTLGLNSSLLGNQVTNVGQLSAATAELNDLSERETELYAILNDITQQRNTLLAAQGEQEEQLAARRRSRLEDQLTGLVDSLGNEITVIARNFQEREQLIDELNDNRIISEQIANSLSLESQRFFESEYQDILNERAERERRANLRIARDTIAARQQLADDILAFETSNAGQDRARQNFESLTNQFTTEQDLITQRFQAEQDIISNAYANGIIPTYQAAQDEITRIQEEADDRRLQSQIRATQAGVGAVAAATAQATQLFQQAGAEQTRLAIALFRVNQAAAIANTIISTQEGATKAYAQLGAFGGPAAAAIIAAGAASVALIASQNPTSGSSGGGGGAATVSVPTPSATVPTTPVPGAGNAGQTIIVNFEGANFGNDSRRSAEELRDLINDGDFDLINPDSANGQRLINASQNGTSF